MFYTFNLLDSSLISRDYHLQTGFTFPFLVGQQNPMYSLNITHPIELGRLFYCCWPHRYYVFMRQCHKISSHFLFRFRLESSKFAGLRPRLQECELQHKPLFLHVKTVAIGYECTVCISKYRYFISPDSFTVGALPSKFTVGVCVVGWSDF